MRKPPQRATAIENRRAGISAKDQAQKQRQTGKQEKPQQTEKDALENTHRPDRTATDIRSGTARRIHGKRQPRAGQEKGNQHAITARDHTYA